MNTTLVDHAAPITFRQLARRFARLGMTEGKYHKTFRLPLAYADILDPKLGGEIVGYRCLVTWYGGSFNARRRPKSAPRSRQDAR